MDIGHWTLFRMVDIKSMDWEGLLAFDIPALVLLGSRSLRFSDYNAHLRTEVVKEAKWISGWTHLCTDETYYKKPCVGFALVWEHHRADCTNQKSDSTNYE